MVKRVQLPSTCKPLPVVFATPADPCTPHMGMGRPLAIAGLVLLAGVSYCWEARAQQLLPVPEHEFFGNNFVRDGLSGPLDKGWTSATVQLSVTSLAHIALFGETKNVAEDLSSEAECICRKASSNGRYCSAWLCMKRAPGLSLTGIADGQAFDILWTVMAAVDNGLQLKICHCTKQATNGNFCVVWECKKYNDDDAR
eukprot:jgi/Chrzof1/14398/Cz09g01030.t1